MRSFKTNLSVILELCIWKMDIKGSNTLKVQMFDKYKIMSKFYPELDAIKYI